MMPTDFRCCSEIIVLPSPVLSVSLGYITEIKQFRSTLKADLFLQLIPCFAFKSEKCKTQIVKQTLTDDIAVIYLL